MVHLLSSDIGRGHPYYLDGVREELAARGAPHTIGADASVFDVAREPSRSAWRAAKLAYLWAGRGGAISRAYGAIRSPRATRSGGLGPRALSRGIVEWATRADVVLVDHPILVAVLRAHRACWYQHGELCAPAASITGDAARVFVPTRDVADAFVRGGVPSARVVVTGLCVDPPFARDATAHKSARAKRLRGQEALTFALFSSGAEPPPHVATLAAAASSIASAGHVAVVFAKRGGALDRALDRGPARGSIDVVHFAGREDLDRATRARFDRFDAYVGPPHERSSWALGLGVPALLVGPDIGPFAPENRALLLSAGVATSLTLDAAKTLGRDLLDRDLRARLAVMSERAQDLPLDGFQRVADAVIDAARGASAP